MTDKTITVTDYPEGTRRERVLALANGAKHALFGGGCSPLPDATLLRAALALDRMRTELPETAVVGVASMFTPENDAEQHEETRALLAERLCDPAAALAAAVNMNRRLLGEDA